MCTSSSTRNGNRASPCSASHSTPRTSWTLSKKNSAASVRSRTSLLRYLLPVVEEALQTDVGEGVLGHLLEDVEGERDDVRPELRGLDHVDRMPDLGHEDLAVPIVVAEDRDDIADHLHPVLADI